MSTRPWHDQTLRLLQEGYGFLPRCRREAGSDVVPLRVLGRSAVAVCGPDWVGRFYDEEHVSRAGVAPEPVRSTLFGTGGVQGLDSDEHAQRRRFFLDSLDDIPMAALNERVLRRWDAAENRWRRADDIVLFDEAARALCEGVWGWCGLPELTDQEMRSTAADMVAMVDGFASIGRRHWRARVARRRQEHRLTRIVETTREHRATARLPREERTPLEAAAALGDPGGRLVDPRTAAIELLNLVRPAVAITWYVAFAAHAMQLWPDERQVLVDDAPGAGTAFAHEVRRWYPFTPFVGGIVHRALPGGPGGEPIEPDNLLLLDVYGQDHHPGLWDSPEAFLPSRFSADRMPDDLLIPQGGGDPVTGHRCPGEPATVTLLAALSGRLARLHWRLRPQSLDIPLTRIPTRPHDGMVLEVG